MYTYQNTNDEYELRELFIKSRVMGSLKGHINSIPIILWKGNICCVFLYFKNYRCKSLYLFVIFCKIRMSIMLFIITHKNTIDFLKLQKITNKCKDLQLYFRKYTKTQQIFPFHKIIGMLVYVGPSFFPSIGAKRAYH